jgi:hypothetical protein
MEGAMTRVLVTISLVTSLFTFSAAFAQNVEQITAIDIGTECPRNPPLGDVPGLALSLNTTGGPVLMLYTVEFVAGPTGAITLVPVIDGVIDTEGSRNRAIGDFSGQVADVTFSRVYALGLGTHTFALRAICQSQVIFRKGWLTVYELPHGRQPKD